MILVVGDEETTMQCLGDDYNMIDERIFLGRGK